MHTLPRLLAVAALFGAALPAPAQYKVIGADGSVTYTDRPPATTNAKVTALNARGGGGAEAGLDLPFELRQPVARYPVTIYTSADCAPCESARQFLQQRGVPYAERRIATEEDAAALERLVGARTVPALTVGAQALRGYAQTDWAAYLDAAGYPRESKLPRGWQPPAPVAMVERAAPVVKPVAPPAPPTAADVPPPDASKIRF